MTSPVTSKLFLARLLFSQTDGLENLDVFVWEPSAATDSRQRTDQEWVEEYLTEHCYDLVPIPAPGIWELLIGRTTKANSSLPR